MCSVARHSTVFRAQKNLTPSINTRGEVYVSRGATLITASHHVVQHLCRTPGQGLVRPEALGSDNGAHSVGGYLLDAFAPKLTGPFSCGRDIGLSPCPDSLRSVPKLTSPDHRRCEMRSTFEDKPEEAMRQFCERNDELRGDRFRTIRRDYGRMNWLRSIGRNKTRRWCVLAMTGYQIWRSF